MRRVLLLRSKTLFFCSCTGGFTGFRHALIHVDYDSLHCNFVLCVDLRARILVSSTIEVVISRENVVLQRDLHRIATHSVAKCTSNSRAMSASADSLKLLQGFDQARPIRGCSLTDCGGQVDEAPDNVLTRSPQPDGLTLVPKTGI